MSTNPNRRLKFHNLGKSGSKNAYTKRAKDWEIVYKELYNTRTEAQNREHEIKSKKSRVFVENLIHNNITSTESCAGQ